MKPLKVLQLLPALDSGGVERGTLEIAEAQIAAGMRAIVASAGGPLVPALEALVARDAAQAGSHPPAQAMYQQVRLGLYTHARPQAAPPSAVPAAPPEPTDAPDAAP